MQRKQLPTCELLERGVRLHAKSFSVLIKGLYTHLSGLLDDIHGHMQNVLVKVPTPANLQEIHTLSVCLTTRPDSYTIL